MKRITTHSPGETAAVGRAMAARLKGGDVVALSGAIGSGKTQFVCGVCEGLGASGHVSSPTFTLINEYPIPGGMVAHVDLYRIRSRAELAELGVEEYFNDRCITCIEWPEQMEGHLPPGVVRVTFEHGQQEQERIITIEGDRL
jgi:tRNA threonylcarbamoyladenosine biosynthesis protein TsaE